MTTTTTKVSKIDLRRLNAARSILSKYAQANRISDERNVARAVAYAEVAEAGIFDFLNNLNSYGVQKLDETELHGRPLEKAA